MLSVLVCARLAAQSYDFQVIECGALTAFPSAMNNEGVVVGAAFAIDSAVDSGFVYANGACTSTTFGGRGTDFLGITNSDEILGLSASYQDYLLTKTGFEVLPPYPGAYESYYFFKNAPGILAGNYYATGLDSYGQGFFYENGQFKTLPTGSEYGSALTLYGLNDRNVGVGTIYGKFYLGFVVQDGKLSSFRYPGASQTFFFGINNKNLIVGSYYMGSSGAYNLFTYDLDEGIWTDLNFPSTYNAATPVGITDSGIIAALEGATGGLVIATPSGN